VQSQRLAIGALEWVLDKSHPNWGFSSRQDRPTATNVLAGDTSGTLCAYRAWLLPNRASG
jgi:hypothetical protein